MDTCDEEELQGTMCECSINRMSADYIVNGGYQSMGVTEMGKSWQNR